MEAGGGVMGATEDSLAIVCRQMRFSDGIESSIHRTPEQFKGIEPFSGQGKISIMVYTFCTQSGGDGVNGEVRCARLCSYSGDTLTGQHTEIGLLIGPWL